ncbi:MAG: hypothetical protein Rubg2KO_02810 [Rubricoccaceae bacterium]
MPTTAVYSCALSALLALSATASAQETSRVDARSQRVLGDRTEQVKTNNGVIAERRSTLVYDPVAGEYIKTVYDASGAVMDQTVRQTLMIGPSPAEAARAERLIRTDLELAALIGSAEYPVTVSGGFPLVREDGHACGPGSRCLMYDMFEVIPPTAKGERPSARRLRFVVVDLRAVQLFARDFDPAVDGNFANPAIRERSRARGY